MKKSNIKLYKKSNLISISNPLSNSESQTYYKNKYFNKKSINFKKKYSKQELKNKVYNFEVYFFFIQKFFKKKIDCLEVGCGEGYGGKYLCDKVNYFATELTDEPINLHNKSILKKINFFKGSFLEINEIKKKKFDAIILNGVLEHLTDLDLNLKFINNILKKNGLLLLNVPNDFNILQKFYLKKNKIKNDKAPWVSFEHNHYFNRKSLEQLFKTKYQKISIMSDFPIDLFLLNKNTNYYKNKLFGKIANEIRNTFYSIFRDKKNLKLNDYIQFCESLSKVGLGRSLIACFKKR